MSEPPIVLLEAPMTLDIKAIEQRIAELRADDEAMTRMPWVARLVDDPHEIAPQIAAEYDGGVDPVAHIESDPDDASQDAAGIARTRNSLASTADMLEWLLNENHRLHGLAMREKESTDRFAKLWLDDVKIVEGHLATSRVEVARLTAELVEMQARAELDSGLDSVAMKLATAGVEIVNATAAERDRLRAEVELMRPVVEAADTWRDDTRKGSLSRDGYELQNAVDNYRARKAWTCPGCNLPYGVGCDSWTAARSHGAKLCLSCQKTGRQP